LRSGACSNAATRALHGKVKVNGGDAFEPQAVPKRLRVTMDHFREAIKETTPVMGVAEDDIKNHLRGDLLEWGPAYSSVWASLNERIAQVKDDPNTPLLSCLIQGAPGSGKTALAAKLALASGFGYVKFIS
jgi:vesicle-fusing ATPase